MKIKLYRHTIKDVEKLPNDEIITYYQTEWSSISTYIPSKDSYIVKTEVKEVYIYDQSTCGIMQKGLKNEKK